MPEFDILVLGGGTGNLVAAAAAEAGRDVAIVEADRLGGTCLNRGCNPSKKLIHRANVAETIRRADSYGIRAEVESIDFAGIVGEVTDTVADEAAAKAARARAHDRVTFYRAEGRFVDDHAVELSAEDGERDAERRDETPGSHDGVDDIDGTRVTAPTVVFAGGSRPLIPDAIEGTDRTDFLTSDDALRLETLPDSLVVVGGGYVAVELGHFFTQMGTDVSIVGHGDVLLDDEDRDVAERLTAAYREKMDLRLGYSVTEIAETDDDRSPTGVGRTVRAEADDGETVTVSGERLLVATGRRPNTDRWNVAATGIETDEKGFVETDEHLRTSVDGVYAIGDVTGDHMFKHAGDAEAAAVVETVVDGDDAPVSYPGMAHAVFGSPQVASLGKPESSVAADVDYRVGTCAYDETALGETLRDDDGFAKAVVGDDGEILGFHVVGPEASTLVHEVNTAVAAGADAGTVASAIHVHPALSEVVQGAFRDALDAAPPSL